MSAATTDLSGNTNFVILKNLDGTYIVPRTTLAAVDLTVANGIGVTGSTIFADLATTANVSNSVVSKLVDAPTLSGYITSRTYSYNLTSATTTANKGKLPTVSAVQQYVPGYVSGYVSSAGVIPNSALALYDTIDTNTTGATVTIVPGKAYKIDVTASSKTLAISSFNTGLWGRESHIELFVANAGYVVAGANVVLANALEPDAVNNCTVRFHDGLAIISVEDHVAGYIVVSATGTTNGTLPYGLASSTQKYVAFNASLNGSSLSMGGVSTNGEKHVVGNGYGEQHAGTILTGSVTCTSKTTFTNLAMSAAKIVANGATELADGHYSVESISGTNQLTIAGATIDLTGNTTPTPVAPAGGIVFASGGATVLTGATAGVVDAQYSLDNVSLRSGTKLTNSAVIDFGSTYGPTISANQTAIISGATFANGSAPNVGAQLLVSGAGSAIVTNTVFLGASSGGLAKCVAAYLGNAYVSLNGCTFSGSGTVLYAASAVIHLSGCEVKGTTNVQNSAAYMYLHGSNKFTSNVYTYGGGGHVVMTDGAIVDLTGNSNSYVFFPTNGGSGAISYGSNVTIITSAGGSVLLNGGSSGTCGRIKNDGTTA